MTTAPMFGQAAELLIDPHAVLTLRQKVLPLNRKLTRYPRRRLKLALLRTLLFAKNT